MRLTIYSPTPVLSLLSVSPLILLLQLQYSVERMLRTNKWNGGRYARNGIRNHDEEDGEREQHRDTERDFLSGVWRQTEADENEHRQHDTRQDDVHYIELIAALEMKREDNVRVSSLAGRIQVCDGPLSLSTSHVPLAVQTEVVRRYHRRCVRYVHSITEQHT